MVRSAAAALPCDRDLPGCRTKPPGAGGDRIRRDQIHSEQGEQIQGEQKDGSTKSRMIGSIGSNGMGSTTKRCKRSGLAQVALR